MGRTRWDNSGLAITLAGIAVVLAIAAGWLKPWTWSELDDLQAQAVEALALSGAGILYGIAIETALILNNHPKVWVRAALGLGALLAAEGVLTAFSGVSILGFRPITSISVGFGIVGCLTGYAVSRQAGH
jgi:hypothetical protein